MFELSLHILDVIENSIRANASIVRITLTEDWDNDVVSISIEDNGTGLPLSPEQILDPFFTTKSNKKTGLGLSFFKETAEMANGTLNLGKSFELNGVAVNVSMQLSHIDRIPLGDLTTTLANIVFINPALDLWVHVILPVFDGSIRVSTILTDMDETEISDFTVMRAFKQQLKTALALSRA